MNQRIAHKICKSITITDTIGYWSDGYVITGLKPYVPYTLHQFRKALRIVAKDYKRKYSEDKLQVKNSHYNTLWAF